MTKTTAARTALGDDAPEGKNPQRGGRTELPKPPFQRSDSYDAEVEMKPTPPRSKRPFPLPETPDQPEAASDAEATTGSAPTIATSAFLLTDSIFGKPIGLTFAPPNGPSSPAPVRAQRALASGAASCWAGAPYNDPRS